VSLSGMSIGEARRAVATALRQQGIATPDLDARVLVAHALGLEQAGLVASAERLLVAGEAAAIESLAARRLAREPVACIVGMKEFWGLPIGLGPSTLVPRPDTETLVEAALALIDARGWREQALRIGDLGTGSGALLLALLSELPRAFGVGTDISTAALSVARDNALRLGFGRRAAFVACAFGEALAAGFDLVVSNPPYIASSDIAALDPEVRDYDPRIALDGGADGLAAYRALAADAQRLLGSGGHLMVELGAGTEPGATEIFRSAGLVVASARADLAGVPRALHIHPAE
jgi:release factor glutamine methyltransferase